MAFVVVLKVACVQSVHGVSDGVGNCFCDTFGCGHCGSSGDTCGLVVVVVLGIALW